ncbi:MAG TPA: hypothetical protein VGX91_08605 [Candidatus Cybelea sp.]|jgi:hypothetical protein|nr:hypothetical protein [Candidatus Cybelea sp.]
MTLALRSFVVLLCALVSMGAAARSVSPGGTTGYANLAQLVARHPLAGVLAGYDRELAALRSTQSAPGLDDLSGRTAAAVAAVGRDVSSAQARAQGLAARSAAADLATENAALATILRLRGAAVQPGPYDSELQRETSASFTAFQNATSQRTARALGEREQQLRERELSLAFDLARRDGSQRLSLRLRLDELHPTPVQRAKLEAELHAIEAREASLLGAMRRENASQLGAYRDQLEREGVAANAQMGEQLRSKAEANLAIHRSALAAASRAADALPPLQAQLALFRSTYHANADARAIANGLGAASGSLATRFAQLAQTDRRSRAATQAQIARLQAERRALYEAIVAQIRAAAARVAGERGLHGIALAAARPAGSADLTSAVGTQLRSALR